MTDGNPYDLGCRLDTEPNTESTNFRFRELSEKIDALQKHIDALGERMDRIPDCPGVSGRGN